jgi:polyhydroxyalkanoate synthesis regulator phasin
MTSTILGGMIMAERTHVAQFLEEVEMTLQGAQKVFDDSQRIESGDPGDYTNVQLQLQQVEDELETLMKAAAPEQRDELYRAQLQVRQLQNHFILKR